MFSLDTYQKIISELKENGLVPTIDWRGITSDSKLLIRHDIDFSVEFAYKLAIFESGLGIKSTFFFMLTSNMYNLLSSENRMLVNQIIDLGHKVSIHFDPTAYQDLEEFKFEKHLFEHVFQVEVDIVSVHRPGPFLDNRNMPLCGIPQTYSDPYFSEMFYLSDSGGRDIRPLISAYLANGRSQGLQLLTHPVWWIAPGKSPTESLDFLRRKNSDFLKSEIKYNCKSYEG